MAPHTMLDKFGSPSASVPHQAMLLAVPADLEDPWLASMLPVLPGDVASAVSCCQQAPAADQAEDPAGKDRCASQPSSWQSQLLQRPFRLLHAATLYDSVLFGGNVAGLALLCAGYSIPVLWRLWLTWAGSGLSGSAAEQRWTCKLSART